MFETLEGYRLLKHRRKGRNLEARYTWTLPLDDFQIQVAIQGSLERLEGMLTSGASGDVYGDPVTPRRFGSFEYSLTWGYGYQEYYDPYTPPYYLQVWDVDKVFFKLNLSLDGMDAERCDLIVYDDRLHEVLDQHGIIANYRMMYCNYQRDIFRLKKTLERDELKAKLDWLKTQNPYPLLDISILRIIDSIVCPEV